MRGRHRAVPWPADLLAGVAGAALVSLPLALAVVRVARHALVAAGVVEPTGLLTIAAVLSLPAGALGGLAAHFTFHGRRSRPEGLMLWRTQFSAVTVTGALAGGVCAVLLFPVLLPLCWDVTGAGTQSPLDAFLAAAVPLILGGAVSGGVGSLAAAVLHRPSRRRH